MKNIIFLFILNAFFCSAQEAFYTKTLKELIAIETLIKENRISDLNKFLDEHLYMGLENNSFVKDNFTDKNVPDDMFVYFLINEENNLFVSIGKKDENNSPTLKITKAKRNSLWGDIFSVIDVGMPYHLYEDFRELMENDKGDSLQFEKISRYEYRHKVDGKYDWKTVKASNFTTMFSNEQAIFYTFSGPGQLSHIDIIVPLDNDKGWDDEVNNYFLIVGNDLQESQTMPSPINIPFFMSLKNFNDRIWRDN